MATAMPVGLRERLAHWWRLRTRAERTALTLSGVALALALLWFVAWDPLQRDTDRLTRRLAEQQGTLAEARRQVDEIAALARAAPAANAGDARAAIEGALSRQNLKTTARAIERVDDSRWRVAFDAVAFDALTVWLESLQRDAGLRAVELSVTARVEPGQVRADVTLMR